LITYVLTATCRKWLEVLGKHSHITTLAKYAQNLFVTDFGIASYLELLAIIVVRQHDISAAQLVNKIFQRFVCSYQVGS
jgi:hypothetical protein